MGEKEVAVSDFQRKPDGQCAGLIGGIGMLLPKMYENGSHYFTNSVLPFLLLFEVRAVVAPRLGTPGIPNLALSSRSGSDATYWCS